MPLEAVVELAVGAESIEELIASLMTLPVTTTENPEDNNTEKNYNHRDLSSRAQSSWQVLTHKILTEQPREDSVVCGISGRPPCKPHKYKPRVLLKDDGVHWK